MRPLIAVAAAALALSACSSSTATSVRDSNSAVPFTACTPEACSSSIDGARYEIVMPASWNGTLLIYSHGYRQAQPAPPDFSPVDTSPEPAPGWGSGEKGIGQALLDQGYAIAGSAYATNGWAVADGVSAAEQVHERFVSAIGTPSRVYVWGDSLGGLITQVVAEKHPEWVSGAAPLCGVLAGVVPNYDLALDTTFAIKTLIDPSLKVAGYASYEESVKAFSGAAQKLVAAAGDVRGGGTAKVLYIAALVDAPSQTKRFDGASIESRVKGTTEALITALGFGTFGRYDVEKRFGGNISGNASTDYSTRISAEDKSTIDAVSPGAVERFDAQLAAAPRITADATARAAAEAQGGSPTGVVAVPTLTLHTAADPLVIDQNESYFRARYEAAQRAGTARADLVQLYTVAPATYPERPGAPFGAGHCNFTASTRLAVISLLDGWVRQGVTPVGEGIAEALPPGTTGYSAAYRPGPWPAA